MSEFIVILPTYNEIENIGSMVEAILSQGERFRILVVDDNSPDGTGLEADRLAVENERVAVLHRSAKQGLGPAYLGGFKQALGSCGDCYLLTMDSDFSHDPKDINALADLAESGYDLIIGSRYCRGGGVDGWSLHRRILSRFGNLYARFILRLGINDYTSGFMCINGSALSGLELEGFRTNGYGFLIELKTRLGHAGARMAESPITFRDRRAGQTKMNVGIALEALIQIPRLAFRLRFGGGR